MQHSSRFASTYLPDGQVCATWGLEGKFRRKLDAPRPSASKERVTDPNVARCHDVIGAVADFPAARTRRESASTGSQIRGSRLRHVAGWICDE